MSMTDNRRRANMIDEKRCKGKRCKGKKISEELYKSRVKSLEKAERIYWENRLRGK